MIYNEYLCFKNLLIDSNYSHADAIDSGSLEGHHVNQEIHNLKDVEELDDDYEEMLSSKDTDLNAEPKPT